MVNEGGMASHQPSQPSQDSAVLQDVSTSARTILQGRVGLQDVKSYGRISVTARFLQ
jgi:hypothetical protein